MLTALLSGLLLATIPVGWAPTGIDALYEKNIAFNTYDSRSSTQHVQPTNVCINGQSRNFTYASSSGTVNVTVPAQHEFTLSVGADGYNTFESTYRYSTLYLGSINLVKIQGLNEISTTLTWSHDATNDLDTHVLLLNGTTQLVEIMYNNKTYSGSGTSITLDVDDTGGGSGEKTAIIPYVRNLTYKFYVYEYTSSPAKTMMQLGAKCVVVKDNITTTVNIPPDGVGRWWHVYDVINGELIIVNTVGTSQ